MARSSRRDSDRQLGGCLHEEGRSSRLGRTDDPRGDRWQPAQRGGTVTIAGFKSRNAMVDGRMAAAPLDKNYAVVG